MVIIVPIKQRFYEKANNCRFTPGADSSDQLSRRNNLFTKQCKRKPRSAEKRTSACCIFAPVKTRVRGNSYSTRRELVGISEDEPTGFGPIFVPGYCTFGYYSSTFGLSHHSLVIETRSGLHILVGSTAMMVGALSPRLGKSTSTGLLPPI